MGITDHQPHARQSSGHQAAQEPQPEGAILTHRRIMQHDMNTKSQTRNPPNSVGKRTIIERLQAHREEIEEMGVRYLAVFGSVARDEATAGSDVDILVDLERPAGLLKLGHLHNFLAAILEREVDVVPRESVRPQVERRISQEALRVL